MKQMYLHVVIRLTSSSKNLFLYGDLTKRSLRKKFIVPYKLGKSVFKGHEIINLIEIKSVHIIKTKDALKQELKELQVRSNEAIDRFNQNSIGAVIVSAGSGWNDEDIVECGEDVTNQYIIGPPGEGTFFTNTIRILNNPWSIRVAGGLLFLVISYFVLEWLKK